MIAEDIIPDAIAIPYIIHTINLLPYSYDEKNMLRITRLLDTININELFIKNSNSVLFSYKGLI